MALLDVRAPAARAAGHIAVSSGVPLHDLEHQHRGLFRTEYAGTTLRSNLGLAVPD